MSVKEISVVQVNDSHAYMEMHPELFWQGDRAVYKPAGGYARLATLINSIRQERPGRTLAFDGGDTIHGTFVAVETRGEALVPVLRELAFDAMTAHWDFAYGPEQLKAIESQVGYPVLASNVYDQESGMRAFAPYLIREINGLRIGIIGIAAWIVGAMMPEKFHHGLRFSLGDQELHPLIENLRKDEKVNLIFVLSHLGFPQDYKLAQEVPGIDLILSSHTHNRLYTPVVVKNTLIIQSGSQGSFLGRLDLAVDGNRVSDYHHRLILTDEKIEPDSHVQSLVNQAISPYRDMLSQVVGKTRTDLNRDRVLETTMDNFLLQGLMDHTQAQVAFSNGWRYGAPIPKGEITRNDLYNIIPVNPPVSMVQLSGEEIWQMMEENLEHTFSQDPFQQMGGYVKRALGLNVYFKIENPEGQRIQELFINNEPVQFDRLYEAAFVTAQGVPTRYGQNRRALDVCAVDVLEKYLQKEGEVSAPLRGTITAV